VSGFYTLPILPITPIIIKISRACTNTQKEFEDYYSEEVMKKNKRINIRGIIFHIEEDGYDQLIGFLESIQKRFSSFEGSTGAIADIEVRITEIFLSKLKESNQVITNMDVINLVSAIDIEFFETPIIQ